MISRKGVVEDGLFSLDLLTGHAEAPLSVLIVDNGFIEVLGLKVRPKRLSEIEFGICRLPKEEVANPVFTTCTDKQLGVGHETLPVWWGNVRPLSRRSQYGRSAPVLWEPEKEF